MGWICKKFEYLCNEIKCVYKKIGSLREHPLINVGLFFLIAFCLVAVAIKAGPSIFESFNYSMAGNKTITYSDAIDYTLQALLCSMGILFAVVIADLPNQKR